jgi:hypothetical protein
MAVLELYGKCKSLGTATAKASLAASILGRQRQSL